MKNNIITALALCMTLPAQARKLYVSNNDNEYQTGSITRPYGTIQAAADKALSGDTIAIMAGTYIENDIKPAKDGTGVRPIVFMPATPLDTVILKSGYNDGTELHSIFDLYQKHYITICGLYFKDYKYHSNAICINGGWNGRSSHITVRDCKFINIGCADKVSWNQFCIVWVYKASHCLFVDNYFSHCYGNAFGINNSSSDNLILQNTFITLYGKDGNTENTGRSRPIDSQDHGFGQNVYFGNYTEDCAQFAYQDRNASYDYIVRNEGYQIDGWFIMNESRCAHNTIQENIAYEAGTGYHTAHWMTGWTHYARMINNIAVNCGMGFFCDKQTYSEYHGNIAFNSKNYNFEIQDSAYYIAGPVFSHNLWFSSGKALSCKYLGKDYSPRSFAKKVEETDAVFATPRFTDVNNHDFTLHERSACRGAGLRGDDVGAYAVYPPFPMGRDSVQAAKRSVYEVDFEALVDTVERGKSTTFNIVMTRSLKHDVTVHLKPIAGNVRVKDYEIGCHLTADIEMPLSVTIPAGSKKVEVPVKGLGYETFECLLGIELSVDDTQAIEGIRRVKLINVLDGGTPTSIHETDVVSGEVIGTEVYNLNGVLVARTQGASVSLPQTLRRGIYIQKIITTKGSQSRKITL